MSYRIRILLAFIPVLVVLAIAAVVLVVAIPSRWVVSRLVRVADDLVDWVENVNPAKS